MWSDEHCSGEFMCKKWFKNWICLERVLPECSDHKKFIWKIEISMCDSKQMPEWSYGVHMSKLMSNYHANWDSNYSTNKGLF